VVFALGVFGRVAVEYCCKGWAVLKGKGQVVLALGCTGQLLLALGGTGQVVLALGGTGQVVVEQ